MFRLAHLSDIHLPIDGPVRRRELIGKRLLGYANWTRSRHKVHRQDILEAILQDMRAHQPDHIAVTGDLVNVAAKREWPMAEAFLETLGRPEDVSVVPGNHDAYVGGSVPQMLKSIANYITGDEPVLQTETPINPFPYLRTRGQIALIGCSTGVPTAPFMATGTLGKAQRERIAELLVKTSERNLFRIVLIHHPPVPGLAIARKRLTDAPELEELLRVHGADLVLHGHNHTATHVTIHVTTPGRQAPIPIIGVPSASANSFRNKPPAQYSLFDIDGGPGSWSMHMTRRGISASADDLTSLKVTEIETTQLVGTPRHTA